MAHEYHLDVPHILQNDCYADSQQMCGAACVQMVLNDLESVGTNYVSERGTQEWLYNQIQALSASSGNWYNPPDGVRNVLQRESAGLSRESLSLSAELVSIFGSNVIPPGDPFRFEILGGAFGSGDFGICRLKTVAGQRQQIDLLTRELVRSVALRGVAPIVAVGFRNAHWIVVNGFVLSGEREVDFANLPNAGKNGDIQAVLIRNPLGRYNYRTKCCESAQLGEITGHNCCEVAYPQEIVSYDIWLWDYLFCERADSFVAIAEIANSFDKMFRTEFISHEPIAKDQIWMGRRDLDHLLDEPIESEGADAGCQIQAPDSETQQTDQSGSEIPELNPGQQALWAIGHFELAKFNPDLEQGVVLPPIAVNRLDRIDGDYLLFQVKVNEKVGALVNIASNGRFNSAAVWPKGKEIPLLPTQEDAPDQTLDHFLKQQRKSLIGKKIRISNDWAPVITDVILRRMRYVWRRTPDMFSALRPSFDRWLRVEGTNKLIPFYQPLYDNCVAVDGEGVITLSWGGFLELFEEYLKSEMSRSMGIRAVLVAPGPREADVEVKYKSMFRNREAGLNPEIEEVRRIVCQYLKAHPRPGLTRFLISAYRTDGFMKSGGGDGAPILTAPGSGGGAGDPCYTIASCDACSTAL